MKKRAMVVTILVSSVCFGGTGKLTGPQAKAPMKSCANPDLFLVIFPVQAPTTSIESNCVYSIGYYPLKVLQTLKDGVLVDPSEVSEFIRDKVIFIKTKKEYVDGDIVRNIHVKSTGIMKYEGVDGAEKTVHAFQELDDAK